MKGWSSLWILVQFLVILTFLNYTKRLSLSLGRPISELKGACLFCSSSQIATICCTSFKQTHCSLSWGIFSYCFCSRIELRRAEVEQKQHHPPECLRKGENDFWGWCWQNMFYTIYQFSQRRRRSRRLQRNDTLPKSSGLLIVGYWASHSLRNHLHHLLRSPVSLAN